MIENDVNATLVATVIMGMTAVLMAWCLAIVAVKEWAQRREGVTRVSTKGLE